MQNRTLSKEDSSVSIGKYHCCSVTKLWLTLCNSMDCSTFPGMCSNSCPLSQWYYLTISSSAISVSFCLQSVPTSGSFPVSQLFASGGQSIRASASESVLPVNIQDWFSLGLTGLMSLLSKRLSRVFSSTTVQKHLFFGAQPCFPRVFVPQKSCLILDDKIIGSQSIHINCPIIKVTLMFQVNVLSF